MLSLSLLYAGVALAVEVPDVASPGEGARPARKDAALIIANERYTNLPAATHADADGDAMESLLETFVGVPSAQVVRLDDATTEAITQALPQAAAKARKGGTLWVYYAGHGAGGGRGQRLLLGSDASADADALAGVSVGWLVDAAARSQATRVVVILDAGFGGVGRAGEELFVGKRFSIGDEAMTGWAKVTVWMGTSGAEPATVFTEARHGLFTWSVVGAMRGWADGKGGTPADREVQLLEAQTYTAGLVRQLGGTAQRPTREPRATLAEWPLSKVAERAPDDRTLDVLAQAARAERIRIEQEKLYVRARRDWQQVNDAVGDPKVPVLPGSPGEQLLRAFLVRYDQATVLVDGQEYAVVVPQATEARTRLDAIARAVPKAQRKSRKKVKTPPPPPVDPTTAPCADLVALEVPAIQGQLDGTQLECLELRIDQETSQTARDKVSRVLLVNADARGDEVEWERLAARHLETIDRSDPDLCLKYALVLSRGDIEDAEDVIRWAEIGLENKAAWVGPVFVSRVYALHRLRAEAASRLWAQAEADRVEDPSSIDGDSLALLRGRAKDYAREWLDYARKSQQDPERPLQLCQSAAGTAQFCAD